MKIKWSEVAFEDLASINDYIAKDAPYYARQFIDKLMTSTKKLASFPEIGRRVPEIEENDRRNIRELIFHTYRIIYEVNQVDEYILVITVVHGSRNLAEQNPKPWEII